MEDGLNIQASVADIKEIFKNKSTRIAAIIFAVGIFSNTINYAIQVYYFTNYAQLTEGQIASVTMIFGVASIIGAWVVDGLMKKLVEKFADYDFVYITLDIDVLDPAFAPGTGTPVKVMDIVEVSLRLDTENQITSWAAAKVIYEAFADLSVRTE